MKMAHVTIHSRCIEASVNFYRQVVHLTIQQDMRPLGAPIVFLANGEGETCVELIAAEEGEAYSGTGISLGFHVENVASYREELAEKGYEPTPLISPNPQTRFFFVKDPNGLSIQFI